MCLVSSALKATKIPGRALKSAFAASKYQTWRAVSLSHSNLPMPADQPNHTLCGHRCHSQRHTPRATAFTFPAVDRKPLFCFDQALLCFPSFGHISFRYQGTTDTCNPECYWLHPAGNRRAPGEPRCVCVCVCGIKRFTNKPRLLENSPLRGALCLIPWFCKGILHCGQMFSADFQNTPPLQ